MKLVMLFPGELALWDYGLATQPQPTPPTDTEVQEAVNSVLCKLSSIISGAWLFVRRLERLERRPAAYHLLQTDI